MPTAVITGANSGIGNALAQILVNEGYKVIAADIEIGDPIKKLGCESIKLDIASPEDIQSFKQQVGNQRIDMLLNVAGIASPPESDTLETVDITNFTKTFAVNTFGPLLLTQALLPNIILSPQPRIAVISSRVGSMGDNSSGGAYSYRASKAAVNSLFKSMAVDLKEEKVPVLLLHPGIVKTNIFKTWKKGVGQEVQGAVEPEVAASELWGVFMGKGLESTGMFYHRNGEELPW
ncbi:NAD(P)-binding protein [Cucurbitaria berberidis CBS 394.84]|uniref:NAD(P)-binding protein n=1 Tax=Cucurbitaria berberidis CBS 394.84 TaxID=1168544 RepID=A0A9P4LDK4_9PLEO|nr:NAD(P)-binding protein [Cucurbitaria berberidis CBS 394.84]KAF1851991.1 NAD(P)-binding protein [Cucurbitaria berberidis CBS 394.84]